MLSLHNFSVLYFALLKKNSLNSSFNIKLFFQNDTIQKVIFVPYTYYKNFKVHQLLTKLEQYIDINQGCKVILKNQSHHVLFKTSKMSYETEDCCNYNKHYKYNVLVFMLSKHKNENVAIIGNNITAVNRLIRSVTQFCINLAKSKLL